MSWSCAAVLPVFVQPPKVIGNAAGLLGYVRLILCKLASGKLRVITDNFGRGFRPACRFTSRGIGRYIRPLRWKLQVGLCGETLFALGREMSDGR